MQAGTEQFRISISCSFTERCSVGEKNHKQEMLAAEPTWRGREGLPEMCPLIFFFFLIIKSKSLKIKQQFIYKLFQVLVDQ